MPKPQEAEAYVVDHVGVVQGHKEGRPAPGGAVRAAPIVVEAVPAADRSMTIGRLLVGDEGGEEPEVNDDEGRTGDLLRATPPPEAKLALADGRERDEDDEDDEDVGGAVDGGS